MRRLVPLLGLIAAAAGALPARADDIRFPPAGKQAFHVSLPKSWRTNLDTRGGMLLVPPAGEQRAMIYIALLVDDALRGQPERAVAAQVAKIAEVALSERQDPARVTDPPGEAVFRGTAFYGRLPAKRGLARTAKIMIFRLAPNTWAQVWLVTQPGMNAAERAVLDRVLNSITLSAEP